MFLFGPPNIEKMKARGDVKGLIKALGYEKDWEIRRDAARALGELKDARAVEPLIAALKDKDSDVREAAAEALDRLGWKPEQDENGAWYWIGKQNWQQC
ncbi:MAG: HEAT repeat domain-containing protein, partial [Anaerolineae bacterium]